LVLSDAVGDAALDVAGIKGGLVAELTDATTDVLLTCAQFDGPMIRKTSQKLKLRTDASQRFEQVMSPELPAYGMRHLAELIVELAGGDVVGYADHYPVPQDKCSVAVTLAQVQRVLGEGFSEAQIQDAFDRLGFAYAHTADGYAVAVPFERLDLEIPEDLIEEVARIIGYDMIPATPLPPTDQPVKVNPTYFAAEALRDHYIADGYSEVYTSVFAETGERVIANKIDGTKPYLRTSLIPGLQEAFEKNKRNKDLLGVSEVRLFEIGAVWKGGKEVMMLGTVSEKEKAAEHPLSKHVPAETPSAYEERLMSVITAYKPYSKYPFITRDIALWTPKGTLPDEVLMLISGEAGDLLVRKAHIDTYEKGDRVSLAFRLVFQSFEKTLTDTEVNDIMKKIGDKLAKQGFEVR
jgi:phenylalanyl-tRNA synthetase beta subunit